MPVIYSYSALLYLKLKHLERFFFSSNPVFISVFVSIGMGLVPEVYGIVSLGWIAENREVREKTSTWKSDG